MNRMIFFANLEFRGLTRDLLLEEEQNLKIITTVNSEFIVKANQDSKFKKIINNSYATFDGQIPFLLAKVKNYSKSFEKISGSDFIYDICNFASKNGKKVFLLGGKDTSNLKSLEILKKKYKNLDISGFSPKYEPYPFHENHNKNIIEKIKHYKPDFLLVGFGAIKQEYWISDNYKVLNNIGVKWVIGIGGTFEFVSGEIKRAPKLFQNIGLEGVYRFFCEPKFFRLKRLLVSLKIFKYII